MSKVANQGESMECDNTNLKKLGSSSPKGAFSRWLDYFVPPFAVSLCFSFVGLVVGGQWEKIFVSAVGGFLAPTLVKLFLYLAMIAFLVAISLHWIPILSKLAFVVGKRIGGMAFDFCSAALGVVVGIAPAALYSVGWSRQNVVVVLGLVALHLGAQFLLWMLAYAQEQKYWGRNAKGKWVFTTITMAGAGYVIFTFLFLEDWPELYRHSVEAESYFATREIVQMGNVIYLQRAGLAVWDFLGNNAANVIAVCAVLFAAYQAYLMRAHNRLSVRPRLERFLNSVEDRNMGQAEYTVELRNNGLGPAMISDWKVFLDGVEQHLPAAREVDQFIKGFVPESTRTTTAFIGKNQVLRASDTLTLLKILVPPMSAGEKLNFEARLGRLDLVVEYASMYGEKQPSLDTRH